MTNADIVHDLDKKYSGENAVACPNEGIMATLPQSGVKSEQHGNMTVHGSGAFLVCGMCGAKQPTARI